MPVYVPRTIEKSAFTSVEALRSLYRPVSVPGKIEKAVFIPVWSCEARIGQFKCQERSTK